MKLALCSLLLATEFLISVEYVPANIPLLKTFYFFSQQKITKVYLIAVLRLTQVGAQCVTKWKIIFVQLIKALLLIISHSKVLSKLMRDIGGHLDSRHVGGGFQTNLVIANRILSKLSIEAIPFYLFMEEWGRRR